MIKLGSYSNRVRRARNSTLQGRDRKWTYLKLTTRVLSGSVAVLLAHSLSTILQLQTDDVGSDGGGGGGGGEDAGADGDGDVPGCVAASSAPCRRAGHRWSSLWW